MRRFLESAIEARKVELDGVLYEEGEASLAWAWASLAWVVVPFREF